LWLEKQGDKTMSILKDLYFEPIPENISAIASGATPIESAERAPDRRK
jgi:hypothetical protein